MIAADVLDADQPAVDAGGRGPTRRAPRSAPSARARPRRSRRRRWCGAGTGRDVARMVELRGVQAAFPVLRPLVLQGGSRYSHDLLQGSGALVRPELLAQLGIAAGDAILIGGQPFTIRGVIAQEPGRRVGAFSFGSRVLVDLDDLRATGLLAFGSRASYQILLRVETQAVDALTRDAPPRLPRPVRQRALVPVDRGPDRRRPAARRELSQPRRLRHRRARRHRRVERHARVRQAEDPQRRDPEVRRRDRRARCSRPTSLQVLLLGARRQPAGRRRSPRRRSRAIPASLTAAFGGVPYGLTGSAVLQGLAVGLLVSLLFALVPLLEVRRVKPLLLLRGARCAAAGAVGGRGRTRAMAGAAARASTGSRSARRSLVSAALVGVAAWQAASLRVGADRLRRLRAVSRWCCTAPASALVRAVVPLASAPWFPLRHAVISLRRPGNQTRVILLAVGLGSFFVLGVRALQATCSTSSRVELERGGAGHVPDRHPAGSGRGRPRRSRERSDRRDAAG